MAPVPVRSARTPRAFVAGLPAWLPALAGILAGLALASVPVWQVLHALRINGAHGFPIDDAWIHLTFARHLHEGLGFVYSAHDPPTAGSTSPFYTLLLAWCFGLTRDEKVLSYTLGIACNLVFLAALGDWARHRLGGAWWAIAAVLLVGSDMRVLILSTSGMETSLFLALVALAFAAHLRGWSWACGLAVAAAVWTRPEGILLAAVLCADAALTPGARRRRLLGVALPAAAGIASYLAFNHHLSGAWLPTTFAAKRAAIYPPIPPQSFLLHDVLPFLTDHGWFVLLPALLAGFGTELWALARRLPARARPETAWCLAVLAAYAILLPTGHRFDRYLVPVLPAAALVALCAVQAFQARVQRGGGWVQHAGPAVPLVLAGAAALQLSAPADAARSFTTWCHYHAVRHERAGRWLAAHTPPSAVIATHDIGAIAFYSGREIVDVAGLVTPDVVSHIRQPGFERYLTQLFAARHVTHLAMLREWMQVTNQAPLFVADPEPEILEIFPWHPGVTHLVSREATSAALTAQTMLREGQVADAAMQVRASVEMDTLNADGWTVWGFVAGTAGGAAAAAEDFHRALRLRPGDRRARIGLAWLAIDAQRWDEARRILAALRAEWPDDAEARDLEAKLPPAPKPDVAPSPPPR